MRWLVVSAVLAACNGSKPTVDAADITFTGEVVDWDSTDASFCGVLGYTLTVHGDPSRTKMVTAPNGRFILPIAGGAPTTRVDLTPPTTPSGCLTGSPTYAIPGILIANATEISMNTTFSARMLSMPRVTSFYSSFGGSFDSTKAQVFVHVEGTPRAVSITGNTAAAQAFSGTAWAAGSTGVDVFFPNVDASGGTTTVSLTGNAVGTGSVPIVAGTFTYVTVIAN
jgi:hypothetical protein